MIHVDVKNGYAMDFEKGLMPALPKEARGVQVLGSKWNHAENEWVISMLAEYALRMRSWCPVPWTELEKMAKRYKGQLDSPPQLAFAVYPLAEAGDVEVIKDLNTQRVYVVPLPELTKTLASADMNWY